MFFEPFLPGLSGTELLLAALLFVSLVFSASTLFFYRRLQGSLATAEESSAALIAHLSDGIYRSSLDGRQLSANPALVRLNGYDTEEEMLRSVEDIAVEWYVEPGRREEFRRILQAEGHVSNFVSEVYRHKTRERIWITESARVVRHGRTGKPLFYEGSVREITETQRRLNQEALFQKLMSGVPGGIFQLKVGASGVSAFTFLSPGFERITGISVQEILRDPATLTQHMHVDDQQRYRTSFLEAASTLHSWEVEFRVETARGGEKWLRLTADPERSADGVTWHGYMADITIRKRQHAQIEALAYRDPLTGLANRRRFFRGMEATMAGLRDFGGTAAVLFIDLDNFKFLNDTAGHDAGDRCLKDVAAILQSNTAEGEIPARIGGDEFVLIIGGSLMDEAEMTQQALVRGNQILSAIRHGCGSHQVSASMGVVVFDGSSAGPDDVLQRADRAMYRAKQAGRDGLAICDLRPASETLKPIELLSLAVADTEQSLDTFQPRRRKLN
ncbi:MAG TPA: diguanylate cyclase [Tianweitania sediminis]|nr:diguanylate cyclase [Tianweitania sediminis]